MCVDAPRQHPSERKVLRRTQQVSHWTFATLGLLRHSEDRTIFFFYFCAHGVTVRAKVKHPHPAQSEIPSRSVFHQ